MSTDSIATLSPPEVVRAMFIKAALTRTVVAGVVIIGCRLFPTLSERMTASASLREFVSYTRPSQIVLEAMRIASSCGTLRLLGNYLKVSCAPSLAHLQCIKDNELQIWFPRSVAKALNYVVLSDAEIFRTLNAATRSDARAMATYAFVVATIQYVAVGLLRVKRNVSAATYKTALALGIIDGVAVGGAYYGGISFALWMRDRFGVRNRALNAVHMAAFLVVGMSNAALIAVLQGHIWTLLISKLQGYREVDPLPLPTPTQVRELHAMDAFELRACSARLFWVMETASIDNGIRAHAVKKYELMEGYLALLQRDRPQYRRNAPRKAPVAAEERVLTESDIPTLPHPKCLSCDEHAFVAGDKVSVLRCGHMVLSDHLASYPADVCLKCFDPVEPMDQATIDASSQRGEQRFWEWVAMWQRTPVLPAELLRTKWVDAGAYLARAGFFAASTANRVPADFEPVERTALDWVVSAVANMLDAVPFSNETMFSLPGVC